MKNIDDQISTSLQAMRKEHWPDTLRGYVALAVGLNFIFAGVAWSALAWRLRSA
jgi:uncharacterized membrane protein HdeD (DUF308 family)